MDLNLKAKANELFVCADNQVYVVDINGKPIPGVRVLVANRPEAGEWEGFTAVNLKFTDDELRNLAQALAPLLAQYMPRPLWTQEQLKELAEALKPFNLAQPRIEK